MLTIPSKKYNFLITISFARNGGKKKVSFAKKKKKSSFVFEAKDNLAITLFFV